MAHRRERMKLTCEDCEAKTTFTQVTSTGEFDDEVTWEDEVGEVDCPVCPACGSVHFEELSGERSWREDFHADG